MAQLALYLDDETVRSLDAHARKDGVSRSAWVREAIHTRLRNRLPESFFEVLGTWEDDRSPEEILADVRQGPVDPEREAMR
jgi:predicted transcriptional regulator